MFRYLDNFLKIALLVLPLAVLVALYVTQRYAASLESTRVELRERAIGQYVTLIENAADNIGSQLSRHGGRVERTNARDRLQSESLLQVLQLPDIEYLYAIYRDAEGGFRIWLDAEKDAAKRSEFGQYFTPASDVWEKVYTQRQTMRMQQEDLEGLWVTVAVPVMQNGAVAAVIGADISYRTEAGIIEDLKSFYAHASKITLLFSSLFLLLFLMVLFYGRRRAHSLKDPLTGAYNRLFFYEVVVKRFSDGYRVMLLDIDHFKQINDTYGHDTGDEVLKGLSKRIRANIRSDDYFVRFGGEEFLLILRERRKEEALQFSQRLLELVASTPFEAGTHSLNITVSIGLNLSQIRSGSVEEAIKAADEALYRAKEGGRNRVETVT